MSDDGMYECEVCKKKRAKDSEICPHCGTKEAHWSVYAKGWVVMLVWVVIVILLERNTEIFSTIIYKILN